MTKKVYYISLRQFVNNNWSYNAGLALDILRNSFKSNDIALMIDKAHSIVSQHYVGDINIVPPRQPMNVTRLFKNATAKELNQFIERGERSTWPKIEIIRNTTCISKTFSRCIKLLRERSKKKLARDYVVAI